MEIYSEFKAIAEKVNSRHKIKIKKILRIMHIILDENIDRRCKYIVDDEGLWINKEDKKTFLSNTVIIPISEVEVYSLGKVEHFLQVVGIRDGKTYLKPVLIRYTELRNKDWLSKSWGFKTVVSSLEPSAYDHIKELMNAMVRYIPTIKKYTYVGWNLDNSSVYLSYGHPIGELSSGNLLMDESLEGMRIISNDCTEKECIDFVLETMLKVAIPEITYTALSFSLLSLFTSLLSQKQRRPEFLFYLYGLSGSRKTTLAKLFFNIFDRYKDQMPINFMATKPAMEEVITIMKDSVCVYDDIAPSVSLSEQNANCEKLEMLVRTYGDSVGRRKMCSEKKGGAPKPLGLAAITAECNLLNGMSSLARCYLVKLEPKDVNLNVLTNAQKNREKYTTAIRFYISYVAQNMCSFLNHIEKQFEKNQRLFAMAYPRIHPRLIMNVAWLKAAMDTFLQYGVDRFLISTEKMKKIQAFNESILKEKLLEQRNLMENDEPAQMFITAITEMLGSGRVKFVSIKRDGKKHVASYSQYGKVLGYQDENYVYLLKNSSYSEVRSFYAKQGSLFPATEKSLVDGLFSKGILKPDGNQDGVKAVRININGRRVSVLRLYKDSFMQSNQEILQSIENEKYFYNEGEL